MLSNSGVNINDSIQVKNHLNIYYNAQFSYFAYQQVISNCATFAGSYVLPRKGTEADFVESAYRFGFNGKEDDNETQTQDYGFRIYNPRLGKFLSVDPLTKSYPELTPYQFSSNNPIWMIDVDGLEGMPVQKININTVNVNRNDATTYVPRPILTNPKKSLAEQYFPSPGVVTTTAKVEVSTQSKKPEIRLHKSETPQISSSDQNKDVVSRSKSESITNPFKIRGFASFEAEDNYITIRKPMTIFSPSGGAIGNVPITTRLREHKETLTLGVFTLNTREVFVNEKKTVYQFQLGLDFSKPLTPAQKSDPLTPSVGFEIKSAPIDIKIE